MYWMGAAVDAGAVVGVDPAGGLFGAASSVAAGFAGVGVGSGVGGGGCDFCRGCGYCMPCPAGIEINTCARMSLLLRRSPSANQLTERGQAMMKKIEGCLHCGACMKKCPYGLNTPKLLEENYEDYKNVLAGKTLV